MNTKTKSKRVARDEELSRCQVTFTNQEISQDTIELIPILVKIVLSNCVGKKLEVPIEIKLSHSFLVYEECLFVHFQMLT